MHQNSKKNKNTGKIGTEKNFWKKFIRNDTPRLRDAIKGGIVLFFRQLITDVHHDKCRL